MPDAIDEMRAYYAERAPYYDAVYDKAERRSDIAFLREHLPKRVADRSLLEVACGTGYWSQFIAPVASSCVVTDGTPEPLAFAKLRPGTSHAAFHLADAFALPSSLGTFDCAFAGLWFSHVPIERRGEFLGSLHALLVPGARVLFLDNSEVQCKEHPIVESDTHGNTYQHRRLRDGSIHRVLKNFPTESELRVSVSPVARLCEYRALENFWLFEYECHPAL